LLLVSVGLFLSALLPPAASAFIVVVSKDGARLVASAATWLPPSTVLVVLPDASERKFDAPTVVQIVDDHGRDRTRVVLADHGVVGRPPAEYQSRLGAGSFPLQTAEPVLSDSLDVLVPMVTVALKHEFAQTVMFAAALPPKEVLLRFASGSERTVEAKEVEKITDAAGKGRTEFVTKGEGAVGVLPPGYGGPIAPEQFEEKVEEGHSTSLEEVGLIALLVAALAASTAFVIGAK
jgi:hypothetical protein